MRMSTSDCAMTSRFVSSIDVMRSFGAEMRQKTSELENDFWSFGRLLIHEKDRNLGRTFFHQVLPTGALHRRFGGTRARGNQRTEGTSRSSTASLMCRDATNSEIELKPNRSCDLDGVPLSR
jgi:hypothetical protein